MSLIVWIMYSCISGVRDGYLYHSISHKKKPKFNEHIIYTIERGIIAGSLMYFTGWEIIIPAVLTFSFFHNGAYYTTRNVLRPGTYPREWFDHSATTTAKISMGAVTRTALFLLGIAAFFLL